MQWYLPQIFVIENTSTTINSNSHEIKSNQLKCIMFIIFCVVQRAQFRYKDIHWRANAKVYGDWQWVPITNSDFMPMTRERWFLLMYLMVFRISYNIEALTLGWHFLCAAFVMSIRSTNIFIYISDKRALTFPMDAQLPFRVQLSLLISRCVCALDSFLSVSACHKLVEGIKTL